MTAPWHEEDEDVEVEDIDNRKQSNDGRDDLTESSSDEAIERKRRKNGGIYKIIVKLQCQTYHPL